MPDDALEKFFSRDDNVLAVDPEWAAAHGALLLALEAGRLRAATRAADGVWRANTWVKRAILLGFRRTDLTQLAGNGAQPFFDKPAYPVRQFALADRVRLVPGGSSVRRGAFVAAGVVVMPPAYVNVGAYVDAGTMVDSHVLVGSCAQIGKNVHLSAGAQIGGVLEPAHQNPVIVEDGAFVGALCGVFEGLVVRERAVLAAGVVLTAATVVHDLVHRRARRGEIPAGAVVIPGCRPASGDYATAQGLQVSAPLIVKYRDARTDVSTALESALR
ncbi:MAG TPA: 2,3,4,5-tetrahydropyridine-2,6-dicarboxylate N-succinyltransferase [Planctomycetota bacterium]|nr:2,3,4,5-tetrahydropyridine-2,6-dicarboxylate N-succinyltransferase [Planctomycetota bacterium]